jgi:hypothetical protein
MKAWLRSLQAAHRVGLVFKRHRSQAGKALAGLLRDGRGLSEADRRLCDAYAADVLGDVRHAPWLRVYTAVAGGFREGWIPDTYYALTVVPRLCGVYGQASAGRALARTLFPTEALPDVAYVANGLVLTPDKAIIPPGEMARFFASLGGPLVFKADSSLQGRAISHFEQLTDPATVLALGNGVLQRRVRQHPALAAFAPESVATLRVTTVVTDTGAIEARAAFLRVGRAGFQHVRSGKLISVTVSLVDGALAPRGYVTGWATLREHPDSGMTFAGAVVPSFDGCVALARELHGRTPFARIIGWDIAVDENGAPALLEWNGTNSDIKFSEATTGPCFADLGWERMWQISDAT